MGIKTSIQYADSTNNLMMGCDGCELLTKHIKICYAEKLTNRFSNRKGWPDSFSNPKMFPYRLEQSNRWSDLTGKDRLGKPWLNGYPRVIFEGDMGDYWTESLPEHWLLPYLDDMSKSPHIRLFLTKRPKRMVETFKEYGSVPNNFFLGTSITKQNNIRRYIDLEQIKEIFPNAKTWVSLEPILDDIYHSFSEADWLVLGGESGGGLVYLTHLKDFDFHLSYRQQENIFVKQLGSHIARNMRLKDKKGGDWDEWPSWLKVREMPEYEA